MTVRELALSANRSIDDVLEALYFVDKAGDYDENSIFEDPPALYETVRKLGAKPKVVHPPSEKKIVSNNDEDVVKR